MATFSVVASREDGGTLDYASDSPSDVLGCVQRFRDEGCSTIAIYFEGVSIDEVALMKIVEETKWR